MEDPQHKTITPTPTPTTSSSSISIPSPSPNPSPCPRPTNIPYEPGEANVEDPQHKTLTLTLTLTLALDPRPLPYEPVEAKVEDPQHKEHKNDPDDGLERRPGVAAALLAAAREGRALDGHLAADLAEVATGADADVDGVRAVVAGLQAVAGVVARRWVGCSKEADVDGVGTVVAGLQAVAGSSGEVGGL